MKKMFVYLSIGLIIVVSIVGFVLFGGKNDNDTSGLAAVVNQEKIQTAKVDERIKLHELLNAVNEKYVMEYFNEDEQKAQIEKTLLPAKKSDVIDELIKGAVIRCEAQKNDLLIEYDKVKDFVDAQHEQLKTDQSQHNYKEIFMKELSARGMTEKECLSLFYDYSYDFYNKKQIENHYKKTGYNSKSQKTFEQQFDAYLDELMTEYSVKVY